MTAIADDGHGFFNVPLVLGASYMMQAGRASIAPYINRTFARYNYEIEDGSGERTANGWTGHLTYGLTVSVDRFAVGAGYRDRDSRFGGGSAATRPGNRGSLVVNFGIGF